LPGKGSYLKLLDSGDLEKRLKTAKRMLKRCCLCPHECRVDRTKGEKGFCRTGRAAIVSSYGAHFGEEAPISGKAGSGTVFFSGCNMSCVYCQNYQVSQEVEGQEVTGEILAFFFLSLQEEGCHNINLVTPSHVVPQILEGLFIAASEGLRIPVVYNSGGYDKVSTLKLLDDVIDIYMPDMKYSDDDTALELSGIKDYWKVSTRAVKEMFRQVGNLQMDENGVAVRGLLIRHLVLPGNLSGSEQIFEFIARELSTDITLNIMDQYRPCWKAWEHPPLDRRLYPEEFQQALESARKSGLKNVMQFREKP